MSSFRPNVATNDVFFNVDILLANTYDVILGFAMRYVAAELCHRGGFGDTSVSLPSALSTWDQVETHPTAEREWQRRKQGKGKRDDSDGRGAWRHRNHSVTRNANTIR